MCSPEWYGVDYVINPWMAGNLHRSSRDASFGQWKQLYSALRQIADVRLMQPKQGAPDMTFVAHGALINFGVAAVSSFTHAERQGEEKTLRTWLEDAGFVLWETPRETPFEGEGDGFFDPMTQHLWLAHGARTCQYSHGHVADAWHADMSSLHLVDPRFYHLDTCFAPLANGDLLYYPPAFDADSLARVDEYYEPGNRITVGEEDALRFACNAVNIGEQMVLNQISNNLLQMSEFLKAGGAAKCLCLKLA
jgi:N-dimethylarginine dimethylaminohydrolase